MSNSGRKSGWIISPGWDLGLVVGSPLVIVPLLHLLSQRVFTPGQISLAVLAFASAGHHLPGFMRAYGERELFQRFKWRFLLAPPAALAAALFFGLQDLHGLALVMLFWSTWHGLMQTYGFMRIYDLKRGLADSLTARLDFWLCLLVFAAGIAFSDSRIFTIAELMMLSGVPGFSPAWIVGLRIAVGAALVLIFIAWLINLWLRGARRGVSWPKAALALSTGWLYWTSGALTTNVLVGVAMFEVFHALQYFAIVWVYNCRLAERVGPRFGPLGFLFQNRGPFFGVYLAAIALFSAPFYFSDGSADHLWARVIAVLYTASAMLHFYYDGFIWKVREPDTRVNLGIESEATDVSRAKAPLAPGILHLVKWAPLVLLLAGFAWLELRPAPGAAGGERALLEGLRHVAANVPELQTRLASAYLDRGQTNQALSAAQHGAKLRPRSASAQYTLGRSLMAAGEPDAAAAAFEAAIDLAPGDWRYPYRLALAQMKLKNWDRAEQPLSKAHRLNPHSAEVARAWGDFHFHQGNLRRALPYYQQAAREDPQSADAWTALAGALAADGKIDLALQTVDKSLALAPQRAALHFQKGDLHRRRGDFAAAAASYRQAAELAPKWLDALNNLGAMHYQQGQWPAAAEVWRKTLAQDHANAAAHYNLALALWKQNQLERARKHMHRAVQLGRTPSREISDAMGLKQILSK